MTRRLRTCGGQPLMLLAAVSSTILRLSIAVLLLQPIFPLKSIAQEDPHAYLENVLDKIQSQSLRGKEVNWGYVRSKAFALASNARTTADTYPAICYALAQLNDNHSFLMNPNGTVERNSYTKSTFSMPKVSVREKGNQLVPLGREAVGCIFVSSHDGQRSEEFASNLRKFIVAAQSRRVVGWILDLRDNSGGNMWPMLVGAGPLNTVGAQGFFNYSNVSIPWYYERGEAGVVNTGGKHANFKVSDSIPDFGDALPMAVLINGRTASSGEAVAISFHGRPRTRFFGKHTAGLSTGNETIKLSDGATLYLTTTVESDRNKKVFLNGLDPDEVVEQGNVPLGASADPVIRKALIWLASRPSR